MTTNIISYCFCACLLFIIARTTTTATATAITTPLSFVVLGQLSRYHQRNTLSTTGTSTGSTFFKLLNNNNHNRNRNSNTTTRMNVNINDITTSNDCNEMKTSMDESDERNPTTTTPTTSIIKSSSIQASIEFAKLIGRLKTTPRTGWVRRGVPNYESVADHSWRVAALSFLLLNNNNNPDDNNTTNNIIDVSKCIQLAVIHDIAECVVGDIAPDDNISSIDKHQLETNAIQQLSSLLHIAISGSDEEDEQQHNDDLITKSQTETNSTTKLFLDLFNEYENRKTIESYVVKDLDLLDMLLQANEYEERYNNTNIDLSDFFISTPVTRFTTKKLQQIATEIHKQRNNRILKVQQQQQLKQESDGSSNDNLILSINDKAFIEEYSKASTSSIESIEQILLAYKQWNT